MQVLRGGGGGTLVSAFTGLNPLCHAGNQRQCGESAQGTGGKAAEPAGLCG